MSKFCGVISKKQGSEDHHLPPLTYGALEALGKWLNEESDSLQDDFKTKAVFVQEQQQKLLKNESRLANIQETTRSLKDKMQFTEQHIEAHEVCIRLLETDINTLEDKANRAVIPSCSICCNAALNKPRMQFCSEQAKLMEILKDTDNAMAHLSSIVNEFESHLPYTIRPQHHYNAIRSILQCHVSTLNNTENKLDILADKLNTVNQLFLQFMALRRYRSEEEAKARKNCQP